MSVLTAESPFIEQSKDQYSPEDQATWRRLYARLLPRWERYANRHYLEGLETLALPPDRIPLLEDVNLFLRPRTGFEARAVAGLVPGFVFFDCLRNRIFPTTITIRSANSMDYLPEPDIFHDLAGHVPMHTDPQFAETLVRFGQCACAASERTHNEEIMKAIGRFFWFTVEFGLMKSGNEMKAYGSGLLSSYGELEHSLESPEVRRLPFDLDTVIHQDFDIHHYQPVLFHVDSFDHLYSLVEQMERKLDGTNS